MHLLIRRSQRDDGWIESSITFILNARLDLGSEEKWLFDKYKLAHRVIYNSEGFIDHLNAADKYREDAAKDDDGLWSIFSNSLYALAHNIMGRTELQLTLQNLIDGADIETQELEELVRIEEFITKSAQYVAQYMQVALTYDNSEELSEY